MCFTRTHWSPVHKFSSISPYLPRRDLNHSRRLLMCYSCDRFAADKCLTLVENTMNKWCSFSLLLSPAVIRKHRKVILKQGGSTESRGAIPLHHIWSIHHNTNQLKCANTYCNSTTERSTPDVYLWWCGKRFPWKYSNGFLWHLRSNGNWIIAFHRQPVCCFQSDLAGWP